MATAAEKMALLNKKATHGQYVSIGYVGYLKEEGKPVARDIKVGLTLKEKEEDTSKTPEQIEKDKARREKIRATVKAKGGFFALDVHTNEVKAFYPDQIFWIIDSEGVGHDYRKDQTDLTKLPHTIDEIDNTPGGESIMDPEASDEAKRLLFNPQQNEGGSPIELGYNPALPKKPRAPRTPKDKGPSTPSMGTSSDPSSIDISKVQLPNVDVTKPITRKPISSLKSNIKISSRDI